MIIFNQKLTIACNKSFPYVKLSRKRSKNKPWIHTGLKQSIKQKHRNTYMIRKKKIIFKNKLRTFIRKAEADCYKESFNHKTQSMKRELWRELGKQVKRKVTIQSVELSLITKF